MGTPHDPGNASIPHALEAPPGPWPLERSGSPYFLIIRQREYGEPLQSIALEPATLCASSDCVAYVPGSLRSGACRMCGPLRWRSVVSNNATSGPRSPEGYFSPLQVRAPKLTTHHNAPSNHLARLRDRPSGLRASYGTSQWTSSLVWVGRGEFMLTTSSRQSKY